MQSLFIFNIYYNLQFNILLYIFIKEDSQNIVFIKNKFNLQDLIPQRLYENYPFFLDISAPSELKDKEKVQGINIIYIFWWIQELTLQQLRAPSHYIFR